MRRHSLKAHNKVLAWGILKYPMHDKKNKRIEGLLKFFIVSPSLDVVHFTPYEKDSTDCGLSDILGILNLRLWYNVFHIPSYLWDMYTTPSIKYDLS